MNDMPGFDHHIDIPGTTIFDGKMAMKGYALNKMCFSFNDKSNRDAFAADEEGYMTRYGLTDQHKNAVRDRNATGTAPGVPAGRTRGAPVAMDLKDVNVVGLHD
jgi:protocatechuate 4,5-dioxygenase, alpha chain